MRPLGIEPTTLRETRAQTTRVHSAMAECSNTDICTRGHNTNCNDECNGDGANAQLQHDDKLYDVHLAL